MANAQFCPICGEIISDGCPELDENGEEVVDENGYTRLNYSPCSCDRERSHTDWDDLDSINSSQPRLTLESLMFYELGQDERDILRDQVRRLQKYALALEFKIQRISEKYDDAIMEIRGITLKPHDMEDPYSE